MRLCPQFSGWKHHSREVINQFLTVVISSVFPNSRNSVNLQHAMCIWQVSTLLSCGEIYQIRIWFSQSHRACRKSRNIHKGWFNEWVLGRLFGLHQVRVDWWLVPLEYRLFAWSKHSHVIVQSLLHHKNTSYQRVIHREWPNTCMWMRWGASFTNRVELRWHLLLCVKCDYALMS